MYALFIAEQFYPEGGAADFYGLIESKEAEHVLPKILEYFAWDLLDHPRRDIHDVTKLYVTVMNLDNPLDIAGQLMLFQYGGRRRETNDNAYHNSVFGRSALKHLKGLTAQYVPQQNEDGEWQ
jgi:hypothetical protein